MTERSGYSPTKGLSKARGDVLNHSMMSQGSSQMKTGRESHLKKGMGGANQKSPARPSAKAPAETSHQKQKFHYQSQRSINHLSRIQMKIRRRQKSLQKKMTAMTQRTLLTNS